jgi:hypothetical protein
MQEQGKVKSCSILHLSLIYFNVPLIFYIYDWFLTIIDYELRLIVSITYTGGMPIIYFILCNT